MSKTTKTPTGTPPTPDAGRPPALAQLADLVDIAYETRLVLREAVAFARRVQNAHLGQVAEQQKLARDAREFLRLAGEDGGRDA